MHSKVSKMRSTVLENLYGHQIVKSKIFKAKLDENAKVDIFKSKIFQFERTKIGFTFFVQVPALDFLSNIP